MDKPKGNTITIKLNGEEQKFNEELKGKGPEAASDSFTDAAEIEPSAIEQDSLIGQDAIEPDGLIETAAAQDTMDESFDWIIPEPSGLDVTEYKAISQLKSKKGFTKKPISITHTSKLKGSNIGSIIFSTVFAVVVGIAFGFMMLKLVIADHGQKAATLSNGTAVTDAANSLGPSSASTVLKSLTTYVIQEGIYSTKDAAKAAVQNASANGLPTKTITMNGKEYLFIGVADSQDNAKKLGSIYKQDGVDVFSKPLATQEKKVSNINENEKSFLDSAAGIYESLVKVTAAGIISNSASTDSLNGMDQSLKTTGIKSATIKNLITELTAAEDKVKSYQNTKNQTDLSNAQQHLLNFLAVYYSM